MSEVLVIPELVDHIADAGIANYSFLRCLNKHFHEVWNSMIGYQELLLYFTPEEREEYYRKARVVLMDRPFSDKLNFTDLPKMVRYIKLSPISYNVLEKSIEPYSCLQTVDFSDEQIDKFSLLSGVKMINYCRALDYWAINHEIERMEKYEGFTGESYKELCLRFSNLKNRRKNSAKNLYIINKNGKVSFKLVDNGDTFCGTDLYRMCQHLVLRTEFEHIDDIVDLLQECRFDSLQIVLTDMIIWSNGYDNFTDGSSANDWWEHRPTITDSDLLEIKSKFVANGHQNVRVSMPE